MDNRKRRPLKEECNSSVGNTFTFSGWKPSSVSVLSEGMTRGIDPTLQFWGSGWTLGKKKKGTFFAVFQYLSRQSHS